MTKITKTHECSRPDCTTEIPAHHDICEYCADDTNDAELAAEERAALTGELISSVYSRHDRTARTTEEGPALKSWAANERERYNRARTTEDTEFMQDFFNGFGGHTVIIGKHTRAQIEAVNAMFGKDTRIQDPDIAHEEGPLTKEAMFGLNEPLTDNEYAFLDRYLTNIDPRIQDVDAAHEEALNTDPSDGFVYRHQNPWTPAPVMTDADVENELWREYEDDRRAQADLYSQIL